MRKLNENNIFNKDAIISICEGIRRPESKIYLPNFHAIQYYIEIPSPQIVGKILDFGLTSRIRCRKLDPTSINKSYINKILNESFEDMAEIVTNFIFDLFLNGALNNLYKGAIPHPFIENIKYNPWNDFITKSREFKLNSLKQSLYDNLIEFLGQEIRYCKDANIKKRYKEMLSALQKETKDIDRQIMEHIKNVINYAEFIKDLYRMFFNPPISQHTYEGEIIPLLKVAA